MGIAERKEREKKERRRQILNAAERHFNTKGFRAFYKKVLKTGENE